MPKPTLILLFLSMITACKTPVITQYPVGPHFGSNELDSFICLKVSDHRKLPDSRFLIKTMHIRLPMLNWPLNYDSLLYNVKVLARQQGGNVIKIGYEKRKFWQMHQIMDVRVFSLEEPFFSSYKAALDSAENIYKDSIKTISIVRIRDVDDQGRRIVTFNDSLIAVMHGSGAVPYRKPDYKTFVFDKKGVLRFAYSKYFVEKKVFDVNIEPGKEYNLLFYVGYHFRSIYVKFALVDKDYFEYVYPPGDTKTKD